MSKEPDKQVLAKVSAIKRELASAKDIVRVIEIRNKAKSLADYCRIAGESFESQQDFAEIKLRAERKCGEMLAGMTLHNGDPRLHDAIRLSELGIEPTASHRWQVGALVPEEFFETYIARRRAEARELTSADIYKEGDRIRRHAKRRIEPKKRLRRRRRAKIEDGEEEEGEEEASTWALMQGNCVDVLAGLQEGIAQLVFADPPYNIGVDYGSGAKGDSLPDEEYLAWCKDWLTQCSRVLTDDGSLWVMIGDEYAAELCLIMKSLGLFMRNWIKWYETFGTNCQLKFNRCSRHLFYFTKSRTKFVFNPEPVTRPSDRQTIYNDRRADHHGKLFDDVWLIPRLTGTSTERLPDFPTQLPLELLRAVVGCASNPGDLVIDPFNGSGTTGVVCIESDRQYIGIEKSKTWLVRAQERLASITPASNVA